MLRVRPQQSIHDPRAVGENTLPACAWLIGAVFAFSTLAPAGLLCGCAIGANPQAASRLGVARSVPHDGRSSGINLTTTSSAELASRWADGGAFVGAGLQPSVEDATATPRVSPLGVVYTVAHTRTAEGDHLVAVCIANIGSAGVPEINVTFALSQPGARIASLRAPAVPTEVSENQARAIFRDILPGQQVQVEAVIHSENPLHDEQPKVAVPEAYRLAPGDPVLVCIPHEALSAPSEVVSAQFIIGGEAVRAEAAAAALSQHRSSSSVPADRSAAGGSQGQAASVTFSAIALTTILELSAILALASLTLVIAYLAHKRFRRSRG